MIGKTLWEGAKNWWSKGVNRLAARVRGGGVEVASMAERSGSWV